LVAGPRLADDSYEFVSLSCRQALSEAPENYGEVSDARIELRGHTLSMRCKFLAHPGKSLSSISKPYLFDLGGGEVGDPIFDVPHSSISPSDGLFVLLVYARGGRRRGQPVGLVLARAGEENATFRRVGYASIEGGSFMLDIPDAKTQFREVEPQTIYLIWEGNSILRQRRQSPSLSTAPPMAYHIRAPNCHRHRSRAG
jgi:hypothetical protein